MGKREGKLRHRLAETLLSWPTPFHLQGDPLIRAPLFRAPHLNLPVRETPVPETPPQPLTRAAVRPRGPSPAQSHLGQQDEELLLAKGLGAAGAHAPLRRHGPAAPGLADLPLLPDQTTGQRRHGAPGGDTPKPAGSRSALGSPGEARSPRHALDAVPRLSAPPTGSENKPQTPPPNNSSRQLPPLGPLASSTGPSSPVYLSVNPTLDFYPLLKTPSSPLSRTPIPTYLSQSQDPQNFQDVVPISPGTFPPYFGSPYTPAKSTLAI